jgi:hypothetical protein
MFALDKLKMTREDKYTVLWSNCYRTKTFLSGYVACVHVSFVHHLSCSFCMVRAYSCLLILYYCILFQLLKFCILVKLAAYRSLCAHIEDANFSKWEFIDLLPICWASCFKLVKEIQEFDSKVKHSFCITSILST